MCLCWNFEPSPNFLSGRWILDKLDWVWNVLSSSSAAFCAQMCVTLVFLIKKITQQCIKPATYFPFPLSNQWISAFPPIKKTKKRGYFFQNRDLGEIIKTMHYKYTPLYRFKRKFTGSHSSSRLECTTAFHLFHEHRCEILFDRLRKWFKIHLREKSQKLCTTNLSLKTPSKGFFLKMSELWD